MKTFQKFQSPIYDQPGNMENWARSKFGLPANVLERHLRIMNDLRTPGGSISSANRNWLLKQAKEAGQDVNEAARTIDRVSRISDPEARARAYVIASGAPHESLVNEAIELSKAYSTTWASTLAEDRLSKRDEVAKASSYNFEDTPELKRSRQEADAVRRSIEATLKDKGLIERDPQTLEEAQQRAVSYAHSAANKLEATSSSAPLRDQIEAAWHVDQAFQRLSDTGVNENSIVDVMEKSDEASFAARSIDG